MKYKAKAKKKKKAKFKTHHPINANESSILAGKELKNWFYAL